MATKKNVAGPLKDLYRQSACQADQFAADIFTAADSNQARSLLSCLSAGRYSEIVSASIDPLAYTNADTFMRDYLCVELMSKYPHWDIGINRPGVALMKFLEIEAKLSSLSFDRNPSIVFLQRRATMRAVEHTARRKIEQILGSFDWNEAHSLFAFGPGASTSQPKRRGDAAFKFGAERPQLSYNAEALASALARAHPSWRFTANVVAGSRLVTVPKNAKTDRSICIEPDLNMYFQKGIGAMIRRRLRRWGLLKPEAQQINAELARVGSATGRLATVDLSSASDSIHMDTVRTLLPADWVEAIEQTRSPAVALPSGKLHFLRKVSSMGNGFTFELETLIFYALCSSVIDLFATSESDRQCTVFGDDIIIASELVQPLREVLDFFGFEMNSRKTFSIGQFRESCGKHYFAGTDVTPFYVRDRIDTVLRKYWAANTIRRFSRRSMCWGLDARWRVVYDNLLATIPTSLLEFKIPDGYGDGGLICDWDEARPSRSGRHWDAWHYQDILPRVKRKKLGGTGVLLKNLHTLEFPATPEARRDLSWIWEYYDQIGGGIVTFIGTELSKRELGKHFVSAVEAEVVEREGLSVLPKLQGFKVHDGYAPQWPSYGPWL